MKKIFFNELWIYMIFAVLFPNCNAGLLDVLLQGNNMTPHQQIFNINKRPVLNPMTRAIQNLAATRNRYNARNQNWAVQPALEHIEDNKQIFNSYINEKESSGNTDFSDNNNIGTRNLNNIAGETTNTGQSRNQGLVTTQVSRIPFVNGNSISRHNRPSENLNVNGAIPLVNRPLKNGGNVGNIHKIIDDINKINNIVGQIKQENAKNIGNAGTTVKMNNGKPDYVQQPNGYYPTVHVNNGIIGNGVHTNLPNNNEYQSINNIDVPPLVNPDINLNTAVTNPQIITPPPGVLMTNVMTNLNKDLNSNFNTTPHNANKIDDKYVLKPLIRRKFFFQVKPVVPHYRTAQNNETLYYVD